MKRLVRFPARAGALRLAFVLCATALAIVGGCKKKPPAEPAGSGGAPLTVQTYTARDEGGAASSHLISGENEAILVDAQLRRVDAENVVETIRATGKILRLVFVTHPHADRYFGASVIRQTFPDVPVLATPAVAAAIRRTRAAEEARLRTELPGALPETIMIPEPYDEETLHLEGRELRIQPLGAGESPNSAVLYVPGDKALIAGDLVSNGVHLWLADGQVNGWLQDLQAVLELGPVETIYPGHGAPGGKELLAQTDRYIRLFAMVTDRSRDSREALREMETLFPTHRMPSFLQRSVEARFARAPPPPSR